MRFEHDLKATVRTIPDYPKPGILFRDITMLLGDARAFRCAVDELVAALGRPEIDKIAGIEARGFILGGAVAARALGRLRADPQEGQAAVEHGADRLFSSNTASTRWKCMPTLSARASACSWWTT